MELVNELYKYKEQEARNIGLLAQTIESLVLILSPFVPHICEEMWESLGNSETLYRHPWPTYDEKALVRETVEVVVQINGKVKERLDIACGLSKEEFEKTCLEHKSVELLMKDVKAIKIIAVPDKLLNIVVMKE